MKYILIYPFHRFHFELQVQNIDDVLQRGTVLSGNYWACVIDDFHFCSFCLLLTLMLVKLKFHAHSLNRLNATCFRCNNDNNGRIVFF